MTPEQEYANKQAQTNQCSSTPQILKDFESCSIEEKVLRLHVTLKDLRRSLEYLHQTNMALNTKIYALEHHQHSEKGDCMIRI